jgi:predicted small secreted protein
MECTALVWVPRPVLRATQVEGEVGEKKPVASAGPGARGLTLGKDRDAGNYRNYAKMESSKLDVFIRDRVPEVLRLHKLFHSRVYELVSALLEIKSRFKNQGVRNDLHELKVAGWHDYLKSIGVNPSTFRTWKHRTETKQLVAIVDRPAPATNRKGSVGTPRKTGPNPARATAAQAAAKNLADAKRQLRSAAAAGSVQAAAIIAEYEQAVITADSSALTDSDVDPVGDDADDDTAESSPFAGCDGFGEVKSAAELLAEHAKMMLDVLTGTSVMSDSMRITRAATLVKDLQRALDEGFLVVTASGPTPTVPVIECEIVPDGNRDAMATLRNVYNRMADTADIENALEVALEEFVQPMMAEHPYMQVGKPYRPELQISVTFYRAGRARINAGDWVEYRGGDDRLKKQIGAEAALGRVVEADGFSRPRITWFNGTKWVKPYALFDEEAVHVLFADQASSAYPEAFSTYSEPALSKPPTAVPTMEADASASSAPSAVAALAASAGAHGMEDARENPVLSNAVSPSPVESLAEDNLPAYLAGAVTLGFLPHGEATWTQLLPGKKYQVRPTPSGGYGIYEARSTVLMQWYAEEDDARGAIDSVIATAACA